VEIDGGPGSVHDVLGRGFALLAAPGGRRWLEAASQAGAALGWPVRGYRVAPDGDLVDKDETFAPAYGLGRDGAVLVRPDAVVAWRAPADARDPGAAAGEALRRLLFRQP
jgi:putative polyketide hydroxylase